jgi:hypothetical protein
MKRIKAEAAEQEVPQGNRDTRAGSADRVSACAGRFGGSAGEARNIAPGREVA